MTTKYTPISETLARDLVDFLRIWQAHPDGGQARILLRTLGEAMAISNEYREHVELLGAELIERVNGASGRQIETTLTPETLRQCGEALRELAPVLGGSVIELPRVPERETQRAIDSAVARVLADMPPPITVVLYVDGEKVKQDDRWEAPGIGHVVAAGDGFARVNGVRWLTANCVEVLARSVPSEVAP